jgi:hypothetical protein
MGAFTPFTPNSAGTVIVTVAATTATVALAKTGVTQQITVSSPAANAVAFIEFGSSSVTAVVPVGTTPGGTPILPGIKYTFTVGSNVTNVATIGTANNTLYFTCGQGI